MGLFDFMMHALCLGLVLRMLYMIYLWKIKFWDVLFVICILTLIYYPGTEVITSEYPFVIDFYRNDGCVESAWVAVNVTQNESNYVFSVLCDVMPKEKLEEARRTMLTKITESCMCGRFRDMPCECEFMWIGGSFYIRNHEDKAFSMDRLTVNLPATQCHIQSVSRSATYGAVICSPFWRPIVSFKNNCYNLITFVGHNIRLIFNKF